MTSSAINSLSSGSMAATKYKLAYLQKNIAYSNMKGKVKPTELSTHGITSTNINVKAAKGHNKSYTSLFFNGCN